MDKLGFLFQAGEPPQIRCFQRPTGSTPYVWYLGYYTLAIMVTLSIAFRCPWQPQPTLIISTTYPWRFNTRIGQVKTRINGDAEDSQFPADAGAAENALLNQQ